MMIFCGLPSELIEEYLGEDSEPDSEDIGDRQWDFAPQPPPLEDDVREHSEREE